MNEAIEAPRKFFDDFVKRSYEAWRAAPSDLLLASCAVHQANVMVERLVRHETRSESLSPDDFDTKVKARRKELAQANPDFALAVDIDDAHKHLELRNSDRAVTSSTQTAVEYVGGGWKGWGGVWGQSWGASPEIVVQLNNGTQRPLAVVLANVIEMWDRRLPHGPKGFASDYAKQAR